MKSLKVICSIVLFSTSFVSTSFARDIIPATGKSAILVQPTVVDGREGSKILNCSYDHATKQYANCKPLGRREFYTRAELENVKARLSSDNTWSTVGYTAAGAAMGAGTGLMLGVFLAPVTGGVSALVAIIAVSAVGGATANGIMTHNAKTQRNVPIIEGAVADRNVTLEVKQYNLVVSALTEELNSLE